MKAIGSVLLIGLLAIGCQQGSTANNGPEIVIASDMPLTAFGSEAPQWEQAIAFAIHQQQTVGGFKIRYWSLDDALGPGPFQSRGLENVKRMEANRWVLGMIGASSSHAALVELPEANSANLAFISPTNTSSCLTVAAPGCDPKPADLRPNGANNFFRISARDPLQGTAMARYAVSKLSVRRVAVFNEWGSDGDAYVDYFSAALAKAGGQVVYRQDFDQGTDNFAAFLTQARAQKADAIYAVANDDACIAALQMKGYLPNAIFLGTDGFNLTGDSCIATAGGAASAEGIFATKPDVDPAASNEQSVKAVVDSYRAAYPRPSVVAEYTFAAYDCARILIAAIEHAIQSNGGTYPSRPQVVAELRANTFAGVTGTYKFDENGDAVNPMMSMYKVQDGRWVNVPL